MSDQEKTADEPQDDAKTQAAIALETYGSRIDAIWERVDLVGDIGNPDRKFRRLAFAIGSLPSTSLEITAKAAVDALLDETPDVEASNPKVKGGIAVIRDALAKAREKICALRNLPLFKKLNIRELIALIAKVLDEIIEKKFGYKFICELAVAAYFFGLDRLCEGKLPEAA